ncbi:hypothetical protein O0I10_012792 [Lichtheimia ornata]|uniref:Uncharacterized protein n=1 Tax=Lichtheimia ornata TaxID=688661 RepID=A0AAD7URA6_9FUNG|nr:uncharacterized protein O0I10_012792 [Lichtheimia ornata]KAJ8651646.1 hypothetical protein O0I10_012792 [Lichtheimia ornata]
MHVPGSLKDLQLAPISRHARETIHKMVDQNMNWASINNVLRIDKKSLKSLMEGNSTTGVPMILRIGYDHVFYAMRKSIKSRARFNDQLESSFEKWTEKIANEDGHSKYLTMDEDQVSYSRVWV